MREQVAVAVGLSGGVDSLATVLKLQQQGFRVLGIHLKLWKEKDLSDIRALTARLGIELICYDGRELFYQKVVEPFLKSYLKGLTPNPCTWCNNSIKWDLLLQAADRLGVEKIATGHYVKIGKAAGHSYLFKGVDAAKDQSYFLWGLPESVLEKAYTPLGDCTKVEVKEWIGREGYGDLVLKKESMGICFLEGCDYREFILRHTGEVDRSGSGEIRDRTGKVIGRHIGLLHYTIGQKRNLPLIDGQPAYVAEIDAVNNCLIVDRKEGLFCRSFCLEQMHMIDPGERKAADIEIKIRGLGLNPAGFIRIQPLSSGKWQIFLDSPAWAVAPGQPVALYRGDRLIGGGFVSL